MIGHLFYFFGLIILLLNIFTISKFKRIFELRKWMVKFKELTGVNPVYKDYRKKDDKDILTAWSISVILTSLWIFFGILSKSWYVYLSILIINTTINILTKIIGEFSVVSFIIHFVKSLLILSLISFLILNHFHLHIDIWESMSMYFN